MNTANIGKWMMGVATTLALHAMPSAFAREIMLVEEGRTPDPRQVAAVFGRDLGSSPKMRGIRVLTMTGNVASAHAPAARELPTRLADCPTSLSAQAANFKVRGVRLPAQAGAEMKLAANVEGSAKAVAGAPDCPPDVAARSETAPAVVKEPVGALGGAPDSIALMVKFRFNSAYIAEDAAPQLDALAEGIKLAGPDVKLVIEGHTDAAGGDQYNLILSYLRANAVKEYLVREHGISDKNLKTVGMGKRAPLNTLNPNAPENRRVEFRIEQT